jgi:hypothetical protein
MNCPQCDSDAIEASLDDEFGVFYECSECGCKFTYDIVILKDGEESE